MERTGRSFRTSSVVFRAASFMSFVTSLVWVYEEGESAFLSATSEASRKGRRDHNVRNGEEVGSSDVVVTHGSTGPCISAQSRCFLSPRSLSPPSNILTKSTSAKEMDLFLARWPRGPGDVARRVGVRVRRCVGSLREEEGGGCVDCVGVGLIDCVGVGCG